MGFLACRPSRADENKVMHEVLPCSAAAAAADGRGWNKVALLSLLLFGRWLLLAGVAVTTAAAVRTPRQTTMSQLA